MYSFFIVRLPSHLRQLRVLLRRHILRPNSAGEEKLVFLKRNLNHFKYFVFSRLAPPSACPCSSSFGSAFGPGSSSTTSFSYSDCSTSWPRILPARRFGAKATKNIKTTPNKILSVYQTSAVCVLSATLRIPAQNSVALEWTSRFFLFSIFFKGIFFVRNPL